ncbi:lytic polysaccharide monooxygenase [Vibrio coralliilyticus]|uniref:lytic polysaccharide monooxygenase n=1 Tax=Vibrio coralliilyticus TaxID=190893 RepID=UPI0005127E0F|nr:lytic polysaccharide monooxygenase [Vibrio coralliilyticus]AIS57067.1 chitin-binding protein [Vibrio coralliilyticus]
MTANKHILKLAVGSALLSALPADVYAHGWSEYPNARQNICYEQGGIWSGSPPNAACSNAKDISGSYPFVQRNEYAKNITDFNNQSAVRAAIPDGTLCYANDPQKRGMGSPHTAWTRTEMNTGTFEYVFNATAPHNPSFWEFYLTKPNADLSKGLAWGDLDLIQETGNVPVENGKYRINVTIPSDRSGDAILFVRWQRDDAAGEGFYNCSDITIKNGNTPPPEPAPEPDLHRGASFIPSGLEAPEIGDVVKYDIINKDGAVARSFDIRVDSNNVGDWDRLLASEINGWHAEFKDGAVFIGDWHEEMQHYMYFQNDPSRNFFNSKDSRASGLMTVSRDDNGNVDPLAGQIYELSQSDNVVNAGDKVVIVTEENATLTQTQGTPVQIQNNGSSSIIIDTQSITQNETLIFSASATNSDRTETFTFEVVVDGGGVTPPPTPEPDPDTGNAWSSSTTYVGGEVVSYAGKEWKAQWWTQGGDDPETTYSKDKWGVWRPAN